MRRTARRLEVRRYRERLARGGLTRFEVVGLDADRPLLQALARRLAEPDAGASDARATVGRLLAPPTEITGRILRALRRSPLVGADLDLDRPVDDGRGFPL